MTKSNDKTYEPQCAFCGKPASLAGAMVSGPDGIHICDECVAICASAIMKQGGGDMLNGYAYYYDEGECNCGGNCSCGKHSSSDYD